MCTVTNLCSGRSERNENAIRKYPGERVDEYMVVSARLCVCMPFTAFTVTESSAVTALPPAI